MYFYHSFQNQNYAVLENFGERYEFYFEVISDNFEYFLYRLTKVNKFPTRKYFCVLLNIIS